ncbi:MAG: hypothetical protein MSG64_17370 [Pyrinomonadaceae bacterium MAG19_C2-C3]|nr:hypothetical protein [Pyrinomonadaceae bacterium MAG19_C2-C3]
MTYTTSQSLTARKSLLHSLHFRISHNATSLLAAGLLLLALSFTVHAQAGALDATFGTGGKTTLNFDGDPNSAAAVVVQPDGKIIIGATARPNTGFDFVLARYNPDGTPDGTFGFRGRAGRNFGADDFLYAIALQPDGKIIAVGSPFVAGRPDGFVIARFNANGTFDASFGSFGGVTTRFGTGANNFGFTLANAVTIQPDGKIVVAGSARDSSFGSQNFALVRYTSAGALDETFGTGGKLITNIPGVAEGVIAQPDGKIVVVGGGIFVSTSSGRSGNFDVARFKVDGTPDATFDGDGRITTNFGSAVQYAEAVALQPDGKIVAVGYATDSERSDERAFASARYNIDGSLDTSFGTSGKVKTKFTGNGSSSAQSVALQSDGKVVVAGSSSISDRSGELGFAVVRYNANGTLDDSFDSDGRLTTSFGTGGSSAQSVAVQGDGKIVVFGDGRTSGKLILARYTGFGALDATFGVNGSIAQTLGGSDEARAVAVQPDSKIVVAGYAAGGLTSVLTRYNTDGTLDTSFGINGQVIENGNEFFGGAAANAVAIQPDGKIVVAGRFDNDFALWRYDANGVLDSTFSFNGRIRTDITSFTSNPTSATDDTINGIIIQPDGRIVAVGNTTRIVTSSNGGIGIVQNFAVARYTANGEIDLSFNGRGVYTTSGGAREAYAVAMQSNGKIIVVGRQVSGSIIGMGVTRFNSDGTLDQTFDGDGIAVIDFVNGFELARAVIIQPDGRIVIAGTAGEIGNPSNFALARLNLNGALDPTFGTNGKVTTDFNSSFDDAFALTLQSNRKIIAAGVAHPANGGTGSPDFALARYNADGALDATFGTNGKAVTDFDANFDVVNAVAIQPGGRIVAVGSAFIGNTRDFAVARYEGDRLSKTRSTGLGRRSRSR